MRLLGHALSFITSTLLHSNLSAGNARNTIICRASRHQEGTTPTLCYNFPHNCGSSINTYPSLFLELLYNSGCAFQLLDKQIIFSNVNCKIQIALSQFVFPLSFVILETVIRHKTSSVFPSNFYFIRF